MQGATFAVQVGIDFDELKAKARAREKRLGRQISIGPADTMIRPSPLYRLPSVLTSIPATTHQYKPPNMKKSLDTFCLKQPQTHLPHVCSNSNDWILFLTLVVCGFLLATVGFQSAR
ncbi:hypothetical protein M408DRAFT_334284 [Serendipita vermifera MAFF 305830]|uniref:Uncharacterized protein n=1 Tax=Serendipita vermifera MAFF 305830 TaxID=933852 RepID=A0A0C2WQ44_SERVB|nr:hypothetical protein M408DRAFT_334285 [Serendipita vermifera MAFF 305830]KIM19752.1 hypothetical protein M408DRAFT_334284 [Serendipita vermifera MAFF 305830]